MLGPSVKAFHCYRRQSKPQTNTRLNSSLTLIPQQLQSTVGPYVWTATQLHQIILVMEAAARAAVLFLKMLYVMLVILCYLVLQPVMHARSALTSIFVFLVMQNMSIARITTNLRL